MVVQRRKTKAEKAQKLRLSLSMSPADQALLTSQLMENSDDYIRRKLITKYNSYYRHWKDLNILVAIFALTGLFMDVIHWETAFGERGIDGRTFVSTTFVTDLIVFGISFMGCIAIIVKFYFQCIWNNYKDPVAFYKMLVKKQVAEGLINQEDLTENFKTERPASWIVRQKLFWIELLLMLIAPMPFQIFSDKATVFEIPSINWVDNSGTYAAQSHQYQTPYYVFDIFLAAMFCRAYFFCYAVIMFSPVNRRLYGKRVCQTAGFEANLSFQVKAGMRQYPI